MAQTSFYSINSAKFIIVQPAKVNMNKTTPLVLAGIAHTGSGVSGCGCDGARMAEEVSARQRHSQQVVQSSSSTAGPELNLQQAASF